MTLNNLGNLHRARNKFDAAEGEYSEALKIYRKLAKKNSEYLLYVASTLNDLAVLHNIREEFDMAESEIVEAIGIYGKLMGINTQKYTGQK